MVAESDWLALVHLVWVALLALFMMTAMAVVLLHMATHRLTAEE